MEYAAQLGSVYGAEVRPHHRTKYGAVLCRMLRCCCNNTLLCDKKDLFAHEMSFLIGGYILGHNNDFYFAIK